MHAGTLEARFGVESIEVLPADIIDVSGAIRSEAWSFSRVTRKPVLEVAAHLLRLICTNGAYSNRELAGARLMAWATDRQLAEFVSRQIERVLEYPRAALLEAVAVMSQVVPTDEEQDDVRILITKHAGKAHAADALRAAVSWYDHWNAVTGAAHHVESSATRRVLEVQGGGILDRFMLKHAA